MDSDGGARLSRKIEEGVCLFDEELFLLIKFIRSSQMGKDIVDHEIRLEFRCRGAFNGDGQLISVFMQVARRP